MKSCVFAGTFDPITIGHQDIILGLSKTYQKVIVVIGQNPQKECFFTENERLQLINECFKDIDNVECCLYSDYKDGYSEFLQSKGVSVYARGIRNKKDLDFEKKMEQLNKTIYPYITTEYVFCKPQFALVSSTLVKEKILGGQEFLSLVPTPCHTLIKSILEKKIK